MATGIDKILADLAKATDRFNANVPAPATTTSASNFTFGSGNPLNTKVDPYAATATNSNTQSTTSVQDSDVATGPEVGGFTPVVPTGTITLPDGSVVEVVDNKIQGPVDTNIGQPGDFTNPTFKAYNVPKKEDPKGGIDSATKDAFASMRMILESYGLADMADTISRMMSMGLSANEALVKLKYDKTIDAVTGKPWNSAYTIRFSGNEKRIANGLNALTEAEYITNENAYAETLRAYGLNNLLSTDRKVNEAKFAEYIANDVSTTEFKDRISTVIDNVVNADPAVMNEFKTYYGGLTTSDIVSYFLSPKETLPILKQKATAAGISAESVKQGLGSDAETRAMEFAKLGITTDEARAGYSNIGAVLPESQKLSNIYKEAGINYDKTAGENEFLLKNADAQRKRKQLASLERGKFSGDSGVSTQGGLSLGKSTQGKY